MDMPMPGDDGGPTSKFTKYSMMMNMQMSFYWGNQATILFTGWPNGTLGMYMLALFFIFFLAAGVEILSILTSVTRQGTMISTIRHDILQSCVYVFKMCLAYMVMLSVMSFNVGVFIAAILGHGVGHFIAKSRDRVVAKGEVVEVNSGGGGGQV